MERAILISVRPQWVEKILNGKKTIEIRKSMPDGHGYKVYIYCTKTRKTGNVWTDGHVLGFDSYRKIRFCNYCPEEDIMNGKVVAEFRLPPVEHIEQHQVYDAKVLEKHACLTIQELGEYTKGKDFYAWHIEDLVIYDKPKPLHEFGVYDVRWSKARKCEMPGWFPLKRPPQSWCYVEK